MIIGWNLYVEEGVMYESLEVIVPLLTKKEKITLQSERFFDNEEVKKIYLSKGQAKRILKEIENNSNWKSGEIDEKINEKMNFYTREKIYNQIPYVENKYWIFTNRSSGVKDKHSIDEIVNDLYYAVSFGVFDLDNNILYYYEYDR
jgi:polyhydroxyalkanoate synthesis regulator phasin